MSCAAVDVMWPVARMVRKIPKVGAALNWRPLIAGYSFSAFGSDRDINDHVLKDWAYLDTFDMLSLKFDLPQTLRAAREWC